MAKSEPNGFDVRYTHEKDIRSLQQWLSHKEVEKWFVTANEQEDILLCKNWISYAKYKSSLTATIFDQPVGIASLFLMPYRKTAHESMFYLVVDPKHWRKGVGFFLMKNLLNLAQNYFKLENVYCEIFEGCPIEGLLEQYKFEKFATQEKYIKQQDNSYLARILYQHFFK